MAPITLADICRYPVKGLSAEHLAQVALEVDAPLPLDRAFAIAHGAGGTEAHGGGWRPKAHFLNLMRNERLAALETAYDAASGVLTIRRHGHPVASGKLAEPVGRRLIEQFFAAYLGEEVLGTPKLVAAQGAALSDVDRPLVSLISLASVHDLERVVGAEVNPVRFRANLYLDGGEPWQEFAWLDREIAIGAARLEVIERIGRCAATTVNPESGARDLPILKALQRGFGHTQMGVYARVVAGGEIAVGERVSA